jgi:hypothetical protein
MTVPEILYQRAIQEGFTVEGAISFIANVQGESAFRCDNAEDRIHRVISDSEYIRRADAGLITYNGKNFIYDEVGFGYIQWTFWSRKKKLYEYVKSRNVSIADHEAQKEFIFIEMREDFPAIYKLCKTSHDIDELMHQLIWIWENPADKQAALSERLPYARTWYAKFNGWVAPEPASVPTPAPAPTPVVQDDDEDDTEKTWPPRMIQNGLNWSETYLLQALLKCHGYNVLICGVFAESLERKVKEFQTANGLTADGVVGPKTWKKLMALPPDF